MSWVASGSTPDGSLTWTGGGGGYNPVIAGTASMTAQVAAQFGPFVSGPSAWATGNGFGTHMFAWVGWSGLAPAFRVYTSSQLGSETEASISGGAGDAFTSGFGASAVGAGFCHVSGGNGSAPPSAGSPFGDSVAWRFERILGYGKLTNPARAIDATATMLVQAAADVGGQQVGGSLQNLVDTDNGLMFVDLLNTLCYWSRPHLAADMPVWQLGMNPTSTRIPFKRDITWSSDPQRVYDAITVTPYTPDGSAPPVFVPSNAGGVNAAQTQFGPRPKNVVSYLQDRAAMQRQADWLFATFGQLARRAEVITIDAASHPLGWHMFFSANVGEIATVFDLPIGGMPASTGNYRISQISRSLSNGANGNPVEGRMTLVLDPVPASYWS